MREVTASPLNQLKTLVTGFRPRFAKGVTTVAATSDCMSDATAGAWCRLVGSRIGGNKAFPAMAWK
jgi:hypothetical protein